MATVIVVDDDFGTSNLIKMLLEMEGFSVSTTVDTVDALAEAEQGVAAFIIDFYLGRDASGLDLLRLIRHHTDESVRSAPVIMVSGDERLAGTVLAEGADRFLLKPYSPKDLTDELHSLIAARA